MPPRKTGFVTFFPAKFIAILSRMFSYRAKPRIDLWKIEFARTTGRVKNVIFFSRVHDSFVAQQRLSLRRLSTRSLELPKNRATRKNAQKCQKSKKFTRYGMPCGTSFVHRASHVLDHERRSNIFTGVWRVTGWLEFFSLYKTTFFALPKSTIRVRREWC